MELFIFARFDARPGHEHEVEQALQAVVGPTRAEPGCLAIHAYRSVREPHRFYIHSRWRDEASFDRHANLPHTVRLVEQVTPLIGHAMDVMRAEIIA